MSRLGTAAAHLGAAARAIIGPPTSGSGGGRSFNALSPAPDTPPDYPVGWYQLGMGGSRGRHSGMATVGEACVNLLVSSVASLPFFHTRTAMNGGRVLDSEAAKILRNPGRYTSSEFWGLAARSLAAAHLGARPAPAGAPAQPASPAAVSITFCRLRSGRTSTIRAGFRQGGAGSAIAPPAPSSRPKAAST